MGLLALLAGIAAMGAPVEAAEVTVAVMPFENGDLPASWRWSWGDRVWQPGAGIADMLRERLERELRGPAIGMVDTDALRQAWIEARLNRQDGVEATQAAEIARSLGADFAVIGRVSQFNVIRSFISFRPQDELFFGDVTIDAKLLDVRSGLPVGSMRGLGRRVQRDRGWDTGERPRVDLSEGYFAGTLLGRSTLDANRALADDIGDRVRTLVKGGGWTVEGAGAVVAIEGSRMTVNLGSAEAIQRGMSFVIRRRTSAPDAAAEEWMQIGSMVVEEAGERWATGPFSPASGAPRPRIGDAASSVLLR